MSLRPQVNVIPMLFERGLCAGKHERYLATLAKFKLKKDGIEKFENFDFRLRFKPIIIILFVCVCCCIYFFVLRSNYAMTVGRLLNGMFFFLVE